MNIARILMLVVTMLALMAGFTGTTHAAANAWTRTGALGGKRTYHTATLLPNGKVLVAGGLTTSTLAEAELYDPATGLWTPTASLNTPRYDHTATLLPNGQVLVTGGFDGGQALKVAELYDPASGTWTSAGTMAMARRSHTATLLSSGQVLIVGGYDVSFLKGAELYNASTNSWTETTSLSTGRATHTATLLSTGGVLVAGGLGDPVDTGDLVSLDSTEIYDPITKLWTPVDPLNGARERHSATLLPSGKVLVVGGHNRTATPYLASAELYDVGGNAWTNVSDVLQYARAEHSATLLPNGKVLVAGGRYASGILTSAEVYDPNASAAADIWTTTGSLRDARANQTATLLPSGRVLVAGGQDSRGSLTSAELYDPGGGTWALTVGSLTPARQYHTATLLPSGNVLVAGGEVIGGSIASAQVYSPTTGNWTTTGSLTTGRSYHTATLLADGQVLVAGGYGSGRLSSAELYNPSTGNWAGTGSLTVARSIHTATLLPNGQVLVAGGHGTAGILKSAELYDPSTRKWTATGDLGAAREDPTATLLSNGKVLVAGGLGESNSYPPAAELYDPGTGGWTNTGTLNTARSMHTATLLPSGKVLVAGGYDGADYLTSAEVYDPTTGLWTTARSMSYARAYHTATLLPSGQVLVAGGEEYDYLNSAEIYDPSTDTWTTVGSLTNGREYHTATLLLNGKVLVAGGAGDASDDLLGSAELYDAGLGYNAVWQPAVNAFSSSLAPGARLTVLGSGFRGYNKEEASGGGTSNSASNYPVVQLRRLDNEQVWFPHLDPTAGFSNVTFVSQPLDNLPAGYALVTVFVNGIPSDGRSLQVGKAPAITAHPANQTVLSGQTASFSAAADGSPTPTVQWQVKESGSMLWADVAGAMATTLSFTASGTDNGKQYRAVFSNALGTVTSNAATLAANNPLPTIASLNPSSAKAGGGSFNLTVNGTGFVSGSVVRWGTTALPTTFVSATQLTAAISPADIKQVRTESCTVVNPAPGGGTSNAVSFVISAYGLYLPLTVR